MNERRSSPDNLPVEDGSTHAEVEVMSSTDRLALTPEEVSQMLGLHLNSVYSMLKDGSLPAIKAGRRWLISKRRFEAWLDGDAT
jgi:excisionase family DNA binding protein